MAQYDIAFSGELVPGAEPGQVKANLARLFQADPQRIELLFSGRRIVIKQGLDEVAAQKYRSTLERAGARVEVLAQEPLIEEIELAPAPVPTEAPAAAPRAGRLQVAPRDEYMAAFSHVDAPDFGVAPLGADLQERRTEVPVADLDLSALSLAPAGSDLGQLKAAPAVLAPDVSHLKVL